MDDEMTTKPRKTWLAGLLSVVVVGLGHVYAGQPGKGALLYLGQTLLVAVWMVVFAFYMNCAVLSVAAASWLLFFLYILLDAIRSAKTSSDGYTLKRFNRWYVYLACWALASFIIQPAVSMTLKSNVIQAYKIPARSMQPTLLVGDRILTSKMSYKKNTPRRGDIVVFQYPKDPSKDFVKRVIGIEGDEVEVRDKALYLNGMLQAEGYVIHGDDRTLPGHVTSRDNFGPVTVPSGALFVMGDNRDNSHDSRFWGFVSLDTVRGKVRHIYWSWDGKGKTVRWERIGESL